VDPIIVAPTTIKTSKKSSKKKKIKIKNLDQQDQQINIPKSYSNNEIEIESFKEDLIKNYQQYKEDGRWLHIVESKISNSLSPSLIRKIESPSSEIDKKENSSEEKELNVTEESISPKSAPEKISIESKINDEKIIDSPIDIITNIEEKNDVQENINTETQKKIMNFY